VFLACKLAAANVADVPLVPKVMFEVCSLSPKASDDRRAELGPR
jgi:hypothetical protein